MPTLFAQVTIPNKDELNADAIVNTFNWTGVDDVEDMCTAILSRLQTFYNTAPSGSTNQLSKFMSTELNFPGARLKIYDASDPEPRVPVFDESMGLSQGTPVATSNLPGEVSLCLSYSAKTVSGGNRRRRRGRIYIGPLNTAAADTSSNVAARPNVNFQTCLKGAGLALAEASTLGASWVVWSRKSSSAAVIHEGYVDNAFDTQRRRGVAPTSRMTWEVETDPA